MRSLSRSPRPHVVARALPPRSNAWTLTVPGAHCHPVPPFPRYSPSGRSTALASIAFSSIALASIVACSADGSSVAATFDAGSERRDADALIDSPFADASGCVEDGHLITVDPDEDHDDDGWSVNDGDCNDCDAVTNPGAFDVAGNDIDEDCSGEADDEPSSCDDGISLATNVPEDGARAIGLCRFVQASPASPQDRRWGVVDSSFVMADGTVGMHYASRGVLTDFGPNVRPQQGTKLLVLSSATARRPSDDDYEPPVDGQMGTSSATPPGWPRNFPSCPQTLDLTPVAFDSAALELKVRVPTNANALSFRFAFFTTEFPAWVCHQYNDYFVTLLTSSADNPGAQAGNICFDVAGNPISANTALLEACEPQVVDGKPYACLLGDAALAGNGFDGGQDEPRGHGGTGWLETTAAVVPGETIDLRFAVWDSGDHRNGSTVVIDDFRWSVEPASGPATVQVPSPK